MHGSGAAELFELADLVHAVARLLPAPPDLEPGPCTAIEINVVRCVARNPGLSARAVADACGLPTSNFSRVLKTLVARGLVERRTDPRDARIAHLHPTELAMRNNLRLREAWGEKLAGAAVDPDAIAAATRALRRIEAHLAGGTATDSARRAERPVRPEQ